MSEFKFACPVCGQHITADSTTSGTQLECPTCFRKIVVPQAPATEDTKFILSAAQVSKPRPTPTETAPAAPPPRRQSSVWIVAGLVGLLCVIGAGAWIWRGKLFPARQAKPVLPTNPPAPPKIVAPKVVYATPTNFAWTLDLTNAVIPDADAAGSLHGTGFHCERALLQGGVLSLRQGLNRNGVSDLAVFVHLFARMGDELSGKTVEVSPDRPPPLPKVVLRWKADQQRSANRTFLQGYAMKLTFQEAAGGRISGRIYLCLPDDDKSFVAGTFEAEIRKPPPPPKQRPPAPPRPKI